MLKEKECVFKEKQWILDEERLRKINPVQEKAMHLILKEKNGCLTKNNACSRKTMSFQAKIMDGQGTTMDIKGKTFEKN